MRFIAKPTFIPWSSSSSSTISTVKGCYGAHTTEYGCSGWSECGYTCVGDYCAYSGDITNCKCIYIKAIRDNILFNFIEDINFLYIKYSNIVDRILKTLIDNNYNNHYILLNIEPKGHGRLARIYPAPIISLPGGPMECKDNNSFEECAFREFYEETLIDINTLNYNILYVDKLKCNKYLYNNKNTYHVSYFFSIKLNNLILSF